MVTVRVASEPGIFQAAYLCGVVAPLLSVCFLCLAVYLYRNPVTRKKMEYVSSALDKRGRKRPSPSPDREGEHSGSDDSSSDTETVDIASVVGSIPSWSLFRNCCCSSRKSRIPTDRSRHRRHRRTHAHNRDLPSPSALSSEPPRRASVPAPVARYVDPSTRPIRPRHSDVSLHDIDNIPSALDDAELRFRHRAQQQQQRMQSFR